MAKPRPKEASGLGPTLEDVQAAGFPMGGENLAIDLADTLVTVTAPPVELLAAQSDSDRFWALHAGLLPEGWIPPDLAATRRLRDAVRTLLDGAQQSRPLDRDACSVVNDLAASIHSSPQIEVRGVRTLRTERTFSADPATFALATAARSAIDVLTIPDLRANLRRCAGKACSMLYVTGDSRRKWCTQNVCGNRDRAARHYRRHRPHDPAKDDAFRYGKNSK